MKTLEEIKNQIKALENTKRYKRKHDLIDKAIAELFNQLENYKEEVIVPAVVVPIVEDLTDELQNQIEDIKDIVLSKVKKSPKKPKK